MISIYLLLDFFKNQGVLTHPLLQECNTSIPNFIYIFAEDLNAKNMIPYQLTILSSGRNVLLIIGIIVVLFSASIIFLTMSLSAMNSKYALFKAYVLASPFHNPCRLQYSRADTSLASVRKIASGFSPGFSSWRSTSVGVSNSIHWI